MGLPNLRPRMNMEEMFPPIPALRGEHETALVDYMSALQSLHIQLAQAAMWGPGNNGQNMGLLAFKVSQAEATIDAVRSASIALNPDRPRPIIRVKLDKVPDKR